MIRRRGWALLGAILLAGGPAHAQQDSAPLAGNRQNLVRELRQRWQRVVVQRLGLTDLQARRLQETNRHFAAQRQALNQAERGVRGEMRAQLTGAQPADDKRLATLLDSLLDIQRQRVVLTQDEQRELALYLTPLQRVRFLALQEQLRLRVEGLRQAAKGRADQPVGADSLSPY